VRTAGYTVVTAMLVILLGSISAIAGNFVSWKGGFHITIPDNFEQIDYRVVDSVLVTNRADRSVFNYEAVFADSSAEPFTAGEYFIINVDSTGELSKTRRDSVLDNLGDSFGRDVGYYPITEFVTNLSTNFPTYDRDLQMASVIAAVSQPDGSVKRNLMLMRFYEHGIATFYYYAPDSIFEAGVDRMREIVASMSTENLDAAVTHEKPKITEARPSDKPETTQQDEDDSTTIVPYLVLVVILVVVLAVQIKKRKSK